MENNLGCSRALKPMLPGERPAPGIYAAFGPALLPSWFLRALCPALARQTGVFWIDAGNSFDAYGAAYAARALGREPASVLRQVRLARPFNLYQLETMILKKLPGERRNEPVVVSDPFAPLYDEDVPAAEARRVFSGVLEGMRSLPAIWLVLAVERPAPEGRQGWPAELARRASVSAFLRPSGARWRLEKIPR